MPSYPKLNFPPVKLRASRRGERTLVWDDLRAMWLVLTPEEWVRRHLIAYLETGCGAARQRIVQEYPVAMNGAPQRADLVVVDDAARPLVLCECKAPEVPIDRHVLAQAVRYNSVLGARYLVLTNGLSHYCYEFSAGEYTQRDRFPTIGTDENGKPGED